ncbi:hypothetical protein [Kineococcus glutinatus]|uniref:SMI1/KNR4 family protein SUKH-1 n=1 Tax=Kineococcus glutinatus TaxID=1070872 RepID=A0ABP9H7X1_9ACTN
MPSTDLADLLSRLEAQWRTHQLPIADHLRPGVDEIALKARLAERGIVPPREVVTWFGWHDGCSDIQFSEAISYGWLMTLDDALTAYDTHVNADPEADQHCWLPIIDRAGDYIVVRCHEDSPDLAMTSSVDETATVLPPQWWQPSLAVPVQWWIEKFETRTWEKGPTGRIMNHGYKDVDRHQVITELL